MYKIKELPPKVHKFCLTKCRNAWKDADYKGSVYERYHWSCDKCEILYEPEDKILYCNSLDKRKCPRCKGSVYSGDKKYYEKRYAMTKLFKYEAVEIESQSKKKWYQFWN